MAFLSNDTPTPDELVARARAIAPSLRARQHDAERTRQIPQANIDELIDAGLYRVLQPKRYGGLEHGLDTFVRLGVEVGAGCGSTGWVYSTGAQHQWQIGMYPVEAQDEGVAQPRFVRQAPTCGDRRQLPLPLRRSSRARECRACPIRPGERCPAGPWRRA